MVRRIRTPHVLKGAVNLEVLSVSWFFFLFNVNQGCSIHSKSFNFCLEKWKIYTLYCIIQYVAIFIYLYFLLTRKKKCKNFTVNLSVLYYCFWHVKNLKVDYSTSKTIPLDQCGANIKWLISECKSFLKQDTPLLWWPLV